MTLLNPTPEARLVDARGRPYFLWDSDMTLAEFELALRDEDEQVRAYFAAKLMRQAKPDDVFRFLSLRQIAELWPVVRRRLGRREPFWTWLLRTWKVVDHGTEQPA